MNCPNCGIEVTDQAVICLKCGAPLRPANVSNGYPSNPSAKSKTAFILLGVFLGGLGIHNFYAGYAGKGVAQLLITVLTCGFAGFITWIWAVIEVCTIQVDASGRPFAS